MKERKRDFVIAIAIAIVLLAGILLFAPEGEILFSPPGTPAVANAAHNDKIDTSDYINVRVCIGKSIWDTSCMYADSSIDGMINTNDYIAVRARMGFTQFNCTDYGEAIYELWKDNAGGIKYDGYTMDECIYGGEVARDWTCIPNTNVSIYTNTNCTQEGKICSEGVCKNPLQPEICDNGIDDNEDWIIDCEDYSCQTDSFCAAHIPYCSDSAPRENKWEAKGEVRTNNFVVESGIPVKFSLGGKDYFVKVESEQVESSPLSVSLNVNGETTSKMAVRDSYTLTDGAVVSMLSIYGDYRYINGEEVYAPGARIGLVSSSGEEEMIVEDECLTQSNLINVLCDNYWNGNGEYNYSKWWRQECETGCYDGECLELPRSGFNFIPKNDAEPKYLILNASLNRGGVAEIPIAYGGESEDTSGEQTIGEGESKSVIVRKKRYDVSINEVDDVPSVKLVVNGEITNSLEAGQMWRLNDGALLKIDSVESAQEETSGEQEVHEGEFVYTSIGDKSYEVSINEVDDVPSVKLVVNGEVTNSMQIGGWQKLLDGDDVHVNDILISPEETSGSQTVKEGETIRVYVWPKSYDVSINYISQTQTRLLINGVTTDYLMGVGDTQKLSDGSYVTIDGIVFDGEGNVTHVIYFTITRPEVVNVYFEIIKAGAGKVNFEINATGIGFIGVGKSEIQELYSGDWPPYNKTKNKGFIVNSWFYLTNQYWWIQDMASYYLDVSGIHAGIHDTVDVRNLVTGEEKCIDKKDGDICSIGNAEIKFSEIDYSAGTVHLSGVWDSDSGTSFNGIWDIYGNQIVSTIPRYFGINGHSYHSNILYATKLVFLSSTYYNSIPFERNIAGWVDGANGKEIAVEKTQICGHFGEYCCEGEVCSEGYECNGGRCVNYTTPCTDSDNGWDIMTMGTVVGENLQSSDMCVYNNVVKENYCGVNYRGFHGNVWAYLNQPNEVYYYNIIKIIASDEEGLTFSLSNPYTGMQTKKVLFGDSGELANGIFVRPIYWDGYSGYFEYGNKYFDYGYSQCSVGCLNGACLIRNCGHEGESCCPKNDPQGRCDQDLICKSRTNICEKDLPSEKCGHEGEKCCEGGECQMFSVCQEDGTCSDSCHYCNLGYSECADDLNLLSCKADALGCTKFEVEDCTVSNGPDSKCGWHLGTSKCITMDCDVPGNPDCVCIERPWDPYCSGGGGGFSCWQETATNPSCGEVLSEGWYGITGVASSPENMFDGNWKTYSEIAKERNEIGGFIAYYPKPTGTTGASLALSVEKDKIRYFNIPSSCLSSGNGIELEVVIDPMTGPIGPARVSIDCNGDGFALFDLNYDTRDYNYPKIYDEAVIWFSSLQ